MFKRILLLPIFVLLAWLSKPAPVSAQALLPYTLQLDAEELEQQGLNLAQDAVQLTRFQQYDLALSRAKLATQLAPNSFETWFILGTLYVQNQQLDEGIEALSKAQSLKPEEAGVLFSLGNTYFQKGDYRTAVSKLEAGLKLESDVPEALFDLGNAYYMLDQYPMAIAAYQKAAAQGTSDTWPVWPAINNIGLVKYEQGDVAGAIEKWQAAIAIDPEAAEPKLAVAVALYTQGKQDRGLALGETAIRSDERYADLEFLKENLWGERLLSDTQKFLANPRIQATIAPSGNVPVQVEVIP
ncbi:MAG: tetratricopeptide repeat protein [Coleofasciculus sp. G1-WW12-02]|uniref:tetratricopeptide repeat protein n=1 Tax=Coleofasciculus sp. G1-WW12-02 TaxID=3068483 RepID=UPI0032F268A5